MQFQHPSGFSNENSEATGAKSLKLCGGTPRFRRPVSTDTKSGSRGFKEIVSLI
jgi:hypothetical protein